MDIRVALILFLLNTNVVQIYTQEYIYSKDDLSKEDFGLDLRDFEKVTDVDIRNLLKDMDTAKTQIQATHIRETSKYCRSFGSCHDCVKSVWYPCEWCHDHGCTDRSDKACPITNEISRNVQNFSSCPYIYSKLPIIVPSGIKKHIQVQIIVPDPALLEKDLVCQIKLYNQMTHLKGVIVKNEVHCFPLKVAIPEGTEVGTFRILWGGVEPLSNEIPLVVYRCDIIASDCEECRQLPQEYKCGWCEDTQVCGLPETCNDLLTWSINRMTCQLSYKQMYFV